MEKDPYILFHSAKSKNYSAILPLGAREISERMVTSVASGILNFLKKENKELNKAKVLVLGFAFKGRPVTSDVRGSTAAKLVTKLKAAKVKNIWVYDPVVKESDVTSHGAKHTKDIKEAFSKADAVVVMNNNPAFENLDIRKLLALSNNSSFLFDTWGLYKKEEIEKVKGAIYKRL